MSLRISPRLGIGIGIGIGISVGCNLVSLRALLRRSSVSVWVNGGAIQDSSILFIPDNAVCVWTRRKSVKQSLKLARARRKNR